MDKTILKNFAIYSRNKLIQETKLKASMLGISEEGIEKPLTESTSDMLAFDIKSIDTHKIHGSDVRKYHRLVNELKNRTKNSEDYLTAYTSLIEEVAYTWFNRLLAIRFMEVNNYMPDRIRVLSTSQKGINEPEIMSQYNSTSIKFSQAEEKQLIEWQLDGSAQAMNSMFQFLFIKQCNKLNENLPDLFETTDDYTELLLTVSYNDQEGVLYKLVNEIPEEYFDIESSDSYGQIEIIGWMYQYYNTELKDEVFARPAAQKISKHDIPAVTQLFTPDWIVKYMVENSLGRLWIEKLIAEGDYRLEKEIAKEFDWKYYIPEADQEDEVAKELEEIRKERKILKLEEIKFMDPAMGSFHIGVYAFEIFMQLYKSQGYVEREAAISIIENNLYGLDIDKRAYQLSYFAIMMKGRQYNRSLLSQNVHNNLNTIEESNNINRDHLEYMGPNVIDNSKRKEIIKELNEILDIFIDAKEYGSILKLPTNYNFTDLIEFVAEKIILDQISIENLDIEENQKQISEILITAQILSMKYDVVVTNPPYLGSRGMNSKLSKYLGLKYPVSKSDLFAVFMEKCIEMTNDDSYYALITQHSWMFLSTYKKLREELKKNKIQNMLHLGTRAFEEIGGEVVQTTSFVNNKSKTKNFIGCYLRLTEFNDANLKEIKTLEAIKNPKCGYFYKTNQADFYKIPGSPIAYWVENQFYDNFEKGVSIDSLGDYTGSQNKTANNSKYLKIFWEVSNCFIGKNKKWVIYSKGGEFRKYFGNLNYIVDWSEEARNYYESNPTSNLLGEKYWYKEGITYTMLTSGGYNFRYLPKNTLFDMGGPAIVELEHLYYNLGLLNSTVASLYFDVFNPTLNLQARDVKAFPIILDNEYKDEIELVVKENISIAENDWNMLESSINFRIDKLVQESIRLKKHSINNYNLIEEVYKSLKTSINSNFSIFKRNEIRIDEVFAKIYNLKKENFEEKLDKSVSVTKIFDNTEDIYDDIKGNSYIQTKEDVVKSFISYAVGCMFGRYSLDEEGLIFAGGKWDINRYQKFIPTTDSVLIISENEYFKDDIVNRFVDFVRVVYGKETLDKNLEFIADALDGRGTPKEIIRNYFIRDFYKHHMTTYSVRGAGKLPIYWLYDSGRNNGFKALVYMHRYNEDTTGVVRIDHLHKMQTEYEHRMDNLRYEITHSDNARDRNRAEKELDKLTKQLKETKDYDEKIGHLAIARIGIDLDDGVKVNHAKVQTDEKGKNLNILAKI